MMPKGACHAAAATAAGLSGASHGGPSSSPLSMLSAVSVVVDDLEAVDGEGSDMARLRLSEAGLVVVVVRPALRTEFGLGPLPLLRETEGRRGREGGEMPGY